PEHALARRWLTLGVGIGHGNLGGDRTGSAGVTGCGRAARCGLQRSWRLAALRARGHLPIVSLPMDTATAGRRLDRGASIQLLNRQVQQPATATNSAAEAVWAGARTQKNPAACAAGFQGTMAAGESGQPVVFTQ